MLVSLEEVRLNWSQAGKDSFFDDAGTDQGYAEAFRDYGLDVEASPVDVAAVRIGKCRIKTELAGALDSWAIARQKARPGSGNSWHALLAIARAADPDEGRDRLRDVLEGKSEGLPAELARLKNANTQTASSFVLVVKALQERPAALAQVVPLLRRAQELHPDDFWVNHSLAYALQHVKPPQLDEAITFYRVAVALQPRSPGVRLNLGAALHEQKKLDEAEAADRKAIELKPDYAAGYVYLGNVLQDQKKLDEAEAACRKAIDLHPNFAFAHNNLGIVLKAKGRLDEAIAAYREALRHNKDYAVAHSNLGNALADKGQWDEANLEYREAIRLKKDYAKALQNLVTALENKGQWDKAIAGWDHYLLGNALRDNGDLAGALTAFRKSIDLAPKLAVAHNNLSWLLASCTELRLRNPQQAVEHGKRAVELAPEEGCFWNTLGVAYYRNGAVKAAVAALRKSVELRNGGDAEDCFFLAMAHWHLGDKDEARQWYDRGLQWMVKNNANNEELRRTDAEATSLLGVKDRTARVLALPKAYNVQPDQLAFGTVYAGSFVEGSFLVFVPGNNADLLPAVTAPKFVKVRHTATHIQHRGPGNDFIAGTVEFVLDTSATGDLAGEISVTLDKAVVKVLVSATVRPAKRGLTRLLIAETPFHRDSVTSGADFKAWTDLVQDSSLDVNYLLVSPGKPVLRDLDLGRFDCVLLTGSGLMELQRADIKQVRKFAESGGRVVVSANAFRRGTVQKANAVLDGYGIQMWDVEATPGDLSHATLKKSDFDPELVKAGVSSAYFFRASPVTVKNDKTGRVLARAVGVGKPGDGFVALAKAGKGEMIALGDSLWWYSILKRRAAGTDTAQLLRWLLEPLKRK
jgi:tetratricopeptide (TPR) repeat protein